MVEILNPVIFLGSGIFQTLDSKPKFRIRRLGPECQMDNAYVVSNHGGRQLDGVPATIDAVRSVTEAVSGTGVEVCMDGGVRKGTDVLKALAMGAKMTFVGRPAVWGLAWAGKPGVVKTLEIMREELDNCMALSGCTSVSQVQQKDVLARNFIANL